MRWKYNDGGRGQYFKARANDCVTRAIAIITGKDYKETYKEIADLIGYTPRNGIFKKDTSKIMEHYGGVWVSCSGKGIKQRTHLKADELPSKGKIICQVTKHVTAVIDGMINDTFDPSRNDTRLVYGYWKF